MLPLQQQQLPLIIFTQEHNRNITKLAKDLIFRHGQKNSVFLPPVWDFQSQREDIILFLSFHGEKPRLRFKLAFYPVYQVAKSRLNDRQITPQKLVSLVSVKSIERPAVDIIRFSKIIWLAKACTTGIFDSLMAVKSPWERADDIIWFSNSYGQPKLVPRENDKDSWWLKGTKSPREPAVAILWFDSPYGQPKTVPQACSYGQPKTIPFGIV